MGTVMKKMLRVLILLLPALVAGFSLTPEQRLEAFKVKLVDQKEQRLEAFKVKLADLKEPKGWTDEYIDNILAIAQEIIRSEGLDPAPLPEEEVSFSDTILGITFHGSAKVYNGQFSGLSTIHRTGNTDFTLDDTTLVLIANLGVSGMSAHYDARAEFQGISVHASATAKIDSLDVYLDTEMTLAPGESLQIADFKVTNIGHISVDVNGLGPLDWILELLVNSIGNSIRGWLADIISGPLKDILQGLLNDYVPEIPSRLLA